ncbi:hypothetical protein TNIN_218751 [Trichonephila inaurata madagascariensis]|uniref:Uncharacterized protein n=1 Tax=Trichonephila inaurata madagascariensis TaxID=2747483 RepID=A0A8X6IPD4_9ARAC|nr:hypothetical protein TNIN_218751 [Trichonephila inaurata madagascariensis]
MKNSTTCQLIQARCRVAPMKSLSIPRLELLACSIGARLSQSVSSDMKLKICLKFFGQTRQMLYIGSKERKPGLPLFIPQSQRNSFVDNTEDWYRSGTIDAADLPSRGCSVETHGCQDGGKVWIG